MKKLFFWLSLATIIFSSNAYSSDQFLYSGFAFAGNYSNREDLYRYSSKIDVTSLDQEFLARLRANPAALSRLNLQKVKIGEGSQISIAFALNSEDVEYQVINGQSKVVLRIFATVLAFDRESKSLLAAYPFGLGTTVNVSTKPDEAALVAMFKRLYFSNEYGEANAFDRWISVFSKVSIKEKFPKYFQVKNVEFESEAKSILAENKVKEAVYKNQIGNLLDAAISSQNNIPVVPSSLGEAVGNKMSYRFSNLSAIDLKLPEPDYELSFVVRGFRNKITQDNGVAVGIYRSLAAVKIQTTGFNKVYLDEKIFHTLFIRVPPGFQVGVDSWPQYKKSLAQLITELSKEFNKVDSKWLEDSVANGTNSKEAFEKTAELFNSLR